MFYRTFRSLTDQAEQNASLLVIDCLVDPNPILPPMTFIGQSIDPGFLKLVVYFFALRELNCYNDMRLAGHERDEVTWCDS